MQYTYKEIIRIVPVSEVIWKCFRCNLTWKEENIADMHRQISKHSITKVKQIAV